MAETIGQAVYELDLDANKFSVKQRQVEAEFKAGQERIARTGAATSKSLGDAEAQRIAKQSRFLATLDSATYAHGTAVKTTESAIAKAATTTSKLTNEQRVLNGALRTSSSQLAQQVPFMRGFSSAMGAAAVAVPQLGVAVIGAALAYEVLDGAVKHFTGSGLIDHLTGAAHAHELAAAAAEHQGSILDTINRIQREGVSSGTARELALVDAIGKVTDAYKAAAAAGAAAGKVRTPQEQLDESKRTGVPLSSSQAILNYSQGVTASRQFDEELKAAAKSIVDAKLNLKELYVVVAQFPELKPFLADELERQAKAAGLAESAMARYEAALAPILQTQADFKSAQGDLGAIAMPGLDSQIAQLELEKTKLEQLKTTLGDTWGPANQADLDNVTRRLAVLGGQQDVVTQSLAIFGEEVRRQYGELAPAAIENVAEAMSHIPEDQRVNIAIILPDLFKIQSAFAAFIAQLRAGATVDIAIRVAAMTAFPAAPQQRVMGRRGEGDVAPDPTSQATDLIKKLTDEINGFQENAVAPLGTQLDKTGGSAGRLADALTPLSAVMDGIITLSEATTLGLTDEQVVILELEMARQKEADAAFRSRIELEKLAAAFPGLTGAEVEFRLGLKAIADELVRSGRSAEQFQLDEWLRPKFDAVKSMIDQIFGNPTRESLNLELQKKELQRKALLLERGGADASKVGSHKKGDEPSRQDKELAKVNKQIEALQREIDLRQLDNDITKIQLQLKDKTLQTDQDVMNAAQFLGTAMESVTGDMERLQDVLGVRVFDAGLRAAAALNAVGAAGGSGFTAAEKHWINGVAESKGEPPPFPGFDLGALSVGRTGTALVHEGETILPTDIATMFRDLYRGWRAGEGAPAPTVGGGLHEIVARTWRAPVAAQVDPRRPDGSSGGHNIAVNLYGIQDEDKIIRRVERTLRDALRVTKYGGSSASSSASRS